MPASSTPKGGSGRRRREPTLATMPVLRPRAAHALTKTLARDLSRQLTKLAINRARGARRSRGT